MSAASRERARKQELELLEKRYGPFPDGPIPLDPEFERLFTWFIKERKEIAKELDVKEVYVTDDNGGRTICIRKQKEHVPSTFETKLAALSLLAFSGGNSLLK